MERSLWPIIGAAGISLGLTPVAYAMEFDLRANVETEYSDNARRTVEPTISERQDNVGLNVELSDQRAYASISMAYAWSYQSFAENSQEDRSLLDGDSSILIGRTTSPLQLAIEHNRRRSLIDPSQIALLSNTDERDVLSVRPKLNLALNKTTFIYLSAQHTSVTFSENSLRNSTREGGDVSFLRQLSTVDSLSIQYSSVDIEYTEFSDYTYKYDAVSLNYMAQLRALSYDVSVGYNKVKQNTDDFGGVQYQVNFEYDADRFTVGGEAGREITDNSTGSGDAVSINGDALTEGAFSGPDQYLRENASLYIQYDSLCKRCDLELRYSFENEEYRSLSLNDSEENSLQATFGYNLTPNTFANITYTSSEQDFLNNPSNSRTSAIWGANVMHQLNRKVDMQFSIEQLSQQSSTSGDTTENRIGLGFGFRY